MKREQYIQRIIEVLKVDGLRLSMEELADRIGVTKKTLYNQFESKEEIINQCMKSIMDNLHEGLLVMDAEGQKAADCFEKGVLFLRHFFYQTSPVLLQDLKKMYPSSADGNHAMGVSFFEEMVERNIHKGIREGSYREDADAALLSKYIAYSIFSFFRHYVMLRSVYSADYYFTQIITYNLKALKK